MKFSKILLIALIFFALSACLVKSLIGENIDSSNETMKKIIKEMGLEKAMNVTRDNIRDVWHKLLNKMYPDEYPLHENTFRGMIEKYTSELPDMIPRIDLAKYFTQERIDAMLQYAKHNYGDKVMDYMRVAFDNMKSLYYTASGTHEETFTEKIKRVIAENTPDMIKDAMKTDV